MPYTLQELYAQHRMFRSQLNDIAGQTDSRAIFERGAITGTLASIEAQIADLKAHPAPRRAKRAMPEKPAAAVPTVKQSTPTLAPRTLAQTHARAHAILDRDTLAEPERLEALPYREVRDIALRSIEARSRSLTPASQDHLDQLVRTRDSMTDGKMIARRIAVTGTPAYESAFYKAMRHQTPDWTPEEGRAINGFREMEWAELRAASEGTGSAGGFGVPFFVDPTLIITGQDTAEIFAASKSVTITTNAWHGVSTPGTSYNFDAEAAVVADGTATLAQPTIGVWAAKAFIPASIELTQDYPGWLDELTSLFAGAYADNLAQFTATGTGTAQPTGIFTSMSNQTTTPAHVVVTSAGSIAGNDVRAALAALPERYQAGASWAMSPTVLQRISALAAPSVTNGLAPHDFVRVPNGPTLLMGRPVLQSSHDPTFSSTTGQNNFCVVGDFSRFVIPVRAGLSVEMIPNLPDPVTWRPTGQRGYWSMVRYGSNVVDQNAFRLLANN